jgi:hypothetical protein
MASNNNNDNTNPPAGTKDWLSLTKQDLDDENTPLGMLKRKPLSYFDDLTRNFKGNENSFGVNVGQFPQNFVVVTGPSGKARILHSLFGVHIDPNNAATSGTFVGISGTHRSTPFKTIAATQAVAALTTLFLPTLQQFDDVDSAEEFQFLMGEDETLNLATLATFPNAHFIHPRVFVDVEGKREWDAAELVHRLISLYSGDLGSDDEEVDQGQISIALKEIYHLLIFLWALSKQYGSPVTLREIPGI